MIDRESIRVAFEALDKAVAEGKADMPTRTERAAIKQICDEHGVAMPKLRHRLTTCDVCFNTIVVGRSCNNCADV